MIWFTDYKLSDLLPLTRNNMVEHLGIELTELGPDFLTGRMPVDHRTVQPMNILHGGASVALAETLGSIAAVLTVDRSKFSCVGMEINANHLRPVSSGFVTGTARAVHLGKRSQVWSIDIVNDAGKPVCISRITMAVIEIPFT
jgi:1,4-dihydroxy-2-naphthoyl-CoA hydrolase